MVLAFLCEEDASPRATERVLQVIFIYGFTVGNESSQRFRLVARYESEESNQ